MAFSQWTPKHMLRVWTDYRLPGDWHRLSVGGGVTMQSHTLGYDRTFSVPGASEPAFAAGFRSNSTRSAAAPIARPSGSEEFAWLVAAF